MSFTEDEIDTEPESGPAPRRVSVKALLVVLVVALSAGIVGYALGQRSDSQAGAQLENASHDHESHDHEDAEPVLPAVPTATDPCSLVTRSEVEAVLGPVGEPVEAGIPVLENQRVCTFRAPDGVSGVSVAITESNASAKVAQFEEMFASRVERLSLGEGEILWAESFNSLVALRDDAAVTVQLIAPRRDYPEARERAERLMKVALERL